MKDRLSYDILLAPANLGPREDPLLAGSDLHSKVSKINYRVAKLFEYDFNTSVEQEVLFFGFGWSGWDLRLFDYSRSAAARDLGIAVEDPVTALQRT